MLNRLLDKPVAVTMVVLVCIVLGVLSIFKLPISLIPNVDIPYITVQVDAPDMSAQEIDRTVVTPLRGSLVQLNYLDDFRSESKDGSATITLTFEQGHNIDFLFIEANEKIDRAMPSLPKIDRPKVLKASATDIPAFYINVTLREGDTDADHLRLSGFCQSVLSKRIEQLPEVAMVDISGTSRPEILVIPDQKKLESAGITMDAFENVLESSNISLSNLSIRDGEYHYNVKFQSFASSSSDIGNIWFKADGHLLQIKDVASVNERPAASTGLDRSDGRNAVVMAVIKQNDAKMADLKKDISRNIELFRTDYPQLEFTVTRDQTELLEYSIRNLFSNILIAILLTCIVIFLFMKDFRSPVLVSLTIPVSLVLSFIFFYLIGLTINIISLSGFLLGVGMMVDNTIILVDNITARWNRGDTLRDAVIRGTAEVRGAMLSSVLTTCAVFIPLVFAKGMAGELFFDQAVTITVVLLTSYFVTIFVVPVYYWQLYRNKPAFVPNRFLEKIQFKNAGKFYDAVVRWTLSNRWFAIVFPVVCACIAGVCIIFMPREKLPPITYTDTVVNIDWNEHITLEENASRTARLESALSPFGVQVTSMLGVQQFVLGHSGDQAMNEVGIYVKCADAASLADAMEAVTAELKSEWPEAIFEFTSSGNIFDMVFSEKQAPLLVKLQPATSEGITVDNLRAVLRKIEEAVPEAVIDGVPTKTDVLYVCDPELMALYGVSYQDMKQVLENCLNGNRLFDIVQGDRSVPVVLGTDAGTLPQILSSTFVQARDVDDPDKFVDIPVSRLMRQTYEQSLKSIVSGAEGNYFPVPLNIGSKDIPSAVSAIRNVVASDRKWDVTFSGSYFSNREMLRSMFLILLVAIALLFLILAAQFESLLQPVIILSEVVIDIAFSLAFCWIFGVSVNLMTLIGLIVVCGIVINDSILKIDTINQLVRDGRHVEDAIHTAGRRRLKSIIMTSITTIFAVCPFLARGSMGDDLQYPMSLVIVVGMVIGTAVSLFFVPAVYNLFYGKK